MKVEYGSQNQEEESAFIRRVVAPPKRNDNRRKQKRMAAVGASVVLLAAGAVCTYVALPSENASQVSSQTLETKNAYLLTPEEDHDDDSTEDFIPDFATYDADNDGQISNAEYIARLAFNRDDALQRVAASRLPSDKKEEYSGRLQRNFNTEVGCVTRLANRDKAHNGAVTEERFPLFYGMIKEFCIVEDTRIPDEFQPVETPAPENEITQQTEPEIQIPVNPNIEPPAEPSHPEPVNPYVQPEQPEQPERPVQEPEQVNPYVHREQPEHPEHPEQPVWEAEQGNPSVQPYLPFEPTHPTHELEFPEPQQTTHVEEVPVETITPDLYEPVPDIYEPVSDVYEPVQPVPDIYEPVPDVYEPVPGVHEPVPDTYDSVPDVHEPVPDTYDSVPDVHEPVPDTYEPVPEVHEPVPDVFEPVPDTYEQVPNTYEPVPDIYEPVPDTYEPVPDVYEPVPDVYEPVPDVHEPVPDVYEPVPADENIIPGAPYYLPEFPPFAPASYDEPEQPGVPAEDQVFMTKEEFKMKIQKHFEAQANQLNQDLAYAQLEFKKASLLKDLLSECIQQASDKFGWYGVYEKQDTFDSAVGWITNTCLTV